MASIQVPSASTVQLDFELLLNAPGVATLPSAVEQTVDWGATATQQIIVSNVGLQDFNFTILEENLGMEAATQSPQAFAFDFENDTFASFFLDTPADWTAIASWPFQYFDGGDFRLNDFSQLYVIHGAYLYTLDTATGEDDLVAYIGVPYPHTLVGMTIAADGTIYAVSDYWYGFGPHESYLWTIDPDHGTPTEIGQITNAEYVGDIAINLDDEMYGVDLEQDVLIQIDPATGGGAVVGPLGLDLWTGTLDFDDDSGVLYMGTWDYLSGQGSLWTMNTETGAPTVVGDFPSGNGIAFLAIAADGLVDIPWLAETPTNGTISAGSTATVDLAFDARSVSGPGNYRGNLHIVTNDPILPDLLVPVTMTVAVGAEIGQIEGVVSGTGYCDEDLYPAEAQVLIESSTGMTWTVSTDPATGHYSQWVFGGAYTVTAQSAGHVATTTTVQVLPGQTTTQDFDLRLNEPCLSFTPTSYNVTLPVDSQLTQTLSIENNGARDLIWSLRETTDTLFVPPIPPFTGELPNDPAPLSIEPLSPASNPDPASGENSLAAPLFGEPAYGLDTGPFNLVHIPDISDPGTWDVLPNVGTFYSGGDLWHGDFSKLYALDYYTNEFVTLDLATGDRTVIGTAHALPGHHWTGLTAATDGTIYGVSTECNVASALYTINRLTGEATLVGTNTSAPCLIDVAINAQGQMYAVDISSDALFQIDTTTGAATAIGLLGFNANHAQSLDFEEESGILYWAAADDYNGSLRRIDTSTGASLHLGYFPNYTGVDCLSFATGGGDPFWSDVPWVSEAPTSGVTPADESVDVDIVFDTTGFTTGQCYTADLGLLHDDPQVVQPARIPLTLCASDPSPLGGSTMDASRDWVPPGLPVTVTVTLSNTMTAPFEHTQLTITLPEELGEPTWLGASSGNPVYDPILHQITWNGDVALDLPETVSFSSVMSATINVCMAPVVEALVEDSLGTTTPLSTAINVTVPDCNCTGSVNIVDVQEIAGRWNTTPLDPGYHPRFDLNGDGQITVLDLIISAQAWN